MNWAKDKRMEDAVAAWDRLQASGEKGKLMREFAASRHIPHQTFQRYATADLSKRQKLGCQAGRKALVKRTNAEFIIQHTVRHDRANTGRQVREIIGNI